MRNRLMVLPFVLALAFASPEASAALVSFTGTGQFTNIANCGLSFPSCSISSGGGGTNNVLDMSGFNNSTLTAVVTTGTNIAVPPNRNDVVIGEISWVNRVSILSDQNFTVNYTFTLAFSAPNSSSDSQSFLLNITQPTNPPGDNVFNLSNATLSGLGPFVVAGVAISDIHFSLAAGTSGSYDGSTWTNPEGATSRLLITADFTAVPEPAAVALLGVGLLGMGVVRRRRRGS
jgi:hypothetical protein